MTTVEKKILDKMSQEISILKTRIDGLVPIDTEGEYKDSYLKKLSRVKKTKTRYSFTDGDFLRI